MSSTDDGRELEIGDDTQFRDVRAEVKRLRLAGQTIRAIAEALGLSKSKVGRMAADELELGIEYADELEDDADLDERQLALVRAAAQARYQPQAPFRFVGMEPVYLDIKGMDIGDPVDMERFLDANNVSVNMADIYRADFADGSVGKGYLDDAVAQIKAAGYRQSEAVDGRWHWERVS